MRAALGTYQRRPTRTAVRANRTVIQANRTAVHEQNCCPGQQNCCPGQQNCCPGPNCCLGKPSDELSGRTCRLDQPFDDLPGRSISYWPTFCSKLCSKFLTLHTVQTNLLHVEQNSATILLRVHSSIYIYIYMCL